MSIHETRNCIFLAFDCILFTEPIKLMLSKFYASLANFYLFAGINITNLLQLLHINSYQLPQCKKGVLHIRNEWNYLHVSMYFTINKHVFLLFKAGVDRNTNGGIWDLLTAGRSEKDLFDRTTVTLRMHLKTTENNIVKLLCNTEYILK